MSSSLVAVIDTIAYCPNELKFEIFSKDFVERVEEWEPMQTITSYILKNSFIYIV